jgi:hypothetical protein
MSAPATTNGTFEPPLVGDADVLAGDGTGATAGGATAGTGRVGVGTLGGGGDDGEGPITVAGGALRTDDGGALGVGAGPITVPGGAERPVLTEGTLTGGTLPTGAGPSTVEGGGRRAAGADAGVAPAAARSSRSSARAA